MRRRILPVFLIVFILMLCGCSKPAQSIKVSQILFGFSSEQHEYIAQNSSDDEEANLAMYTALAQDIVVETSSGSRDLFGEGGILEEIEAALSNKSGEEAITLFVALITEYSSDTVDTNIHEGYPVKLEGEDIYVADFTRVSRALYNDSPNSAVGKCFVGDELAICFSGYGAHILIIRSVG